MTAKSIAARLDARPIQPWVPDDALAADFAAPILKAEAEATRALLTVLRTDSIDSAVARLGLVGLALGRWLSDTRIGQTVRDVGRRARDAADRVWSREVGRVRGRPVALSREPSAAELDKWTAENLRRVKSLRASAIAQVQRELLDAQRRGLSAEVLAARWERDGLPVEFGTMRGRATVIARDQLGKLAANIAEAQQRALGVTHYRWRGRLDSRERLHHVDREGDLYAWARPPGDGHPGHPVLCRCYAEPVLSAELLERGL
jgi:SPP1 gp7 family putative phage head morphogenesis protein